VEASLGVSVLGLVAGEVPNDESLVTAAREEHVGAIIQPKLAHLHFFEPGDGQAGSIQASLGQGKK